MPIVRIEVNQGRSESELRTIGDAIHDALVTTCAVPSDDRFQVFTEHSPVSLSYDKAFMGMDRSEGIIIVQVTLSVGRTTEQKVAFFERAAQLLAEKAGARPDDIFINLVEVERENWSFGKGIAQYVRRPEQSGGPESTAKTVGPFSPWRRIGQMVATSGQIGLGEGGKVVEGGFGPELQQALRNLGNVLADAGVARHQVIKVNVYLVDLADWSALNGPYADFFGSSLPARTAFATSALPLGAKVEIEAWAVVDR